GPARVTNGAEGPLLRLRRGERRETELAGRLAVEEDLVVDRRAPWSGDRPPEPRARLAREVDRARGAVLPASAEGRLPGTRGRHLDRRSALLVERDHRPARERALVVRD